MPKSFALLGALIFSVHAAVAQNGGYVIQGPGQRAIEDATAAYDRGIVAILQGRRSEAAKWYRLAAEQGDTRAQFSLGLMYNEGVGVPQNHTEAMKWYRRAADQGHPMAQFFLGLMYAYGEGVPQDYVRAHMWFNLAATAETAERRLLPAENRDLVARKMTPTEIAEAEKLASEWKPKPER
jgi:uncharacterized protein